MFALLLSSLAAGAYAAVRTSPPDGSITVCSNGCDFSTIQKAVDSVSSKDSSEESSIFIYSGTYTEQVTIPELSGKLTVYGATNDTTSYAANTVQIQWYASQKTGAADNEHTAALINHAAGSAVYNVDIENTYGRGSQAVALAAYNTHQSYYGLRILGYQDTLLAQTGDQLYARCFVEGATDFIFGQHARIWITQSTISAVAAGYITANGRPDDDDPSYYVIDNSTVKGTAGKGSVYLGRPWRAYARVCVQQSILSSVINSAGWKVWSTSDVRTDHVAFQECENTGDGASGERASFSTELSEPLSMVDVLEDYEEWVDMSYI